MSGTDKMAALVRPPLEDFTSDIGAITTASVTKKKKIVHYIADGNSEYLLGHQELI